MRKSLLLIVVLSLCALVRAQELTTDSIAVESGKVVFIEQQPDYVHLDSADIYYVAPKYAHRKRPVEVWLPDPQKSLWYAFLFPGLGQIYNRSYWKLPIVYGGAVGLGYGIAWNNKYYKAYAQAYRDIMDSDPTTRSYEKLLPYGTDPTSSYAQTLMKNNHNTYRRYRDLCIVGAIAFYALTIVDAYVDAQLADFDISPDLSMHVSPSVFLTENNQQPNFGLELGVNF